MQEWHDYFQSRRTNRPQFTLPSRIVLRGNHDALIHSLQRFELGESGEGTHLKAVAAQLAPEVVLYTLFARACDPVLGLLKASGQHTDEQIIEMLLSTCFDGLAGAQASSTNKPS